MKRAFLKRPLTLYRLGTLLLLTFSLTGGKILTPGEIMWQEGVLYRIEGHQLQQQGNLEQAATAYRKAVTVNPSYAEAYNDLGVVLESMGDFAHAEEAYQTALKFKPNLASAHSNLALLYEETNRVKEAAVHWGARVRLGPPDDSWVIKAREKLIKYQLAVPETVVEKRGKKAKEIRLAIETGKSHLEGKQYDKAIAEFERALKMDPTNGEATRLLRSAKTWAQQDQSRQVRGLEAAQARVKKEAGTLQRQEEARKAEIERERSQKEQLKKIEETRRKAADAQRKAQRPALVEAPPRASAQRPALEEAPPSQRMIKAAKRIEAEKRAEEIEKRVAVEKKSPPAPADAQAIAREIIKERSKVQGQTAQELNRRAVAAMREDRYQDAADVYKQILILDPGNRSAKQGLERAQKALAKEAR